MKSPEPISIAITPHADGAILAVKAHPGAKRNALAGQHAGALRVSVVPAAEKGRANRAIIEVLAASLGLRKNQIELVSGKTAAQKRLLIREVTPADLKARVRAALAAIEQP